MSNIKRPGQVKYYVNYRCLDERYFISKGKTKRMNCRCIGTITATPTNEAITGGLDIGDVGTDIKGNRLKIISVQPYIGSRFYE